MTPTSKEQMAEWFRDLFQLDVSKLILSLLIILSVLPFFEIYALVFFGIFVVELFGRYSVLRQDLRRGNLSRVEAVFFFIDTLATLSFLPIEILWDDIRFLRLIRLSRMLLLFGYWGPIVREIWVIMMKRERRYQLFFVAATVAILSFLTAILLFHFNDDPKAKDEHFWKFLWWSFRQIEDPGNMVQNAKMSLAFFCSLFLTISGLFLFSFLIGIASSVVEELVRVGRERRIGYRRHSVICNISPFTRVLLEELTTYYAKSLRSPKIITMGPVETRYSYMYEAPLNKIRYRQGQPLSRHDLLKVDADRATRVILLGKRDRETSDSEVVSQILSVREASPQIPIYAELFRRDNLPAALKAGGQNTVPILAHQMVSLYLAKIVSFPGVEDIYTELLTSLGDEIYTCVYGQGVMADRAPPSGPLLPFGELLVRAHRAYGVILLGHLIADEQEPTGFVHSLTPGAHHPPAPAPRPVVPGVDTLRGFFGVAANFEGLRDFVDSLPDVSSTTGPEGDAPIPDFGLCPVATAISKILICGFHDGLIDFCEQMILSSHALTIYLLVPDEQQIRHVIDSFLNRPEDNLPYISNGVQVHFDRQGEDEISYAVEEQDARGGRIRLLHGDWSNERTMISQPSADYRLSEMDAVLFTYTSNEADPDARTALGLLKLLNLKEGGAQEVKPNLRIVCEVMNTEKAMLLKNRFGRRSREQGSSCHSISIVAAESMRNSLLAQSVFVPGIVTIYRELLSEAGEEICRLLVTPPDDPDQRLTFGALLASMYRSRRLILLAVELMDPEEGPRLVVNPRRRSPDYRFRAGELVTLFVIGDYASLARAHGLCTSCYIAGDAEPPGEPPPDGDPSSPDGDPPLPDGDPPPPGGE